MVNKMTPKVSICIPTYDSDGINLPLINKNLKSCITQNYNNYEIIVSDHSPNDNVKKLIDGLNTDKIKYLKNPNNIGYPAHNTNNAILNSTGEFIKIMNQDDYFNNESVLTNMVSLLGKHKWVLNGFTHQKSNTEIYYSPIIPKINGDGKHLLEGVNTVGCPSVGLIPKGELIDVDVIYMIDCELWYRLFVKYGNPGVVNDHDIIIVMGDHNLSTKLINDSKSMILKDKDYCYKKYKI